jgi:hypothetical protein
MSIFKKRNDLDEILEEAANRSPEESQQVAEFMQRAGTVSAGKIPVYDETSGKIAYLPPSDVPLFVLEDNESYRTMFADIIEQRRQAEMEQEEKETAQNEPQEIATLVPLSVPKEKAALNKPLTLYLSGGITNVPNYFNTFAIAEQKLTQQGYRVINPAKVGGALPPDTPYEDHMRVSMTLVDIADAICMLPDWEQSRGAVYEKHRCEILGKPVFYLEQLFN